MGRYVYNEDTLKNPILHPLSDGVTPPLSDGVTPLHDPKKDKQKRMA